MNDELSKVFDVSKPSRTSPGHTSRPIIVGHRPSMPDPMMRPQTMTPKPLLASTASASTQPPQSHPSIVSPAGHAMTGLSPGQPQPISLNGHHAQKVVSVSDNVRSSIAASEPHLPSLAEAKAAPAVSDAAPPAIVSASPPTVETPAAGFMSTATVPGGNTIAPMATPSVSEAPAPQPAAPEVHHQSLPMGHEPSTGARRARHFALWLFIALVLAGFGTYLAIDAGFISTSFQLPFHIFDRQA